ncbi:MAG: hypothetical protein ACNI3A_13015 [Desulfovibrio sp.]|uniref:hypothetical protein n=1 Tax=Desulfovibrio sp. 7SRBS1 TaxID=3378064 RepID=UPI003B3C44C4
MNNTQYDNILVVAADINIRESIATAVSALGGKAHFAENCNHALNMTVEYMDAVIYMPQRGKCSLQAMSTIKAFAVNAKILFAMEEDVCTPAALAHLLSATEATSAAPNMKRAGVFNAARYSMAASL